ncbi:MAG TPA: PrsW family glutamic-type intramembrane protease [Planctomycetaceae bacterium]|jgi:RsiW-degrading membrane proteinase PrsW (M82 family)
MPIRVHCSECDKPLKVAEKFAGKRIRCPGCQTVITLPPAVDPADLSSAVESGAPTTSTAASAVDVPDDWLFGHEAPPAGVKPAAESEEYERPEEPPNLPPRRSQKKLGSTFVTTRGASDSAESPQRARQSMEPASLPARPTIGWRDQLFWVLLLAIAPLAISTVWHERPAADRFKETLQHLPDDATPDQPNVASPPVEMSVDDFFATLPGHKIAGAHLARDSWVHWAYATLSATLFLTLLTQTFPNNAASPARLVWTGVITGTIGIILLLAFQWIAAWTLTFNVRGRGILVVLFYIVKFIGFSYRSALDPENGFLLSFMGFTCGVGLCEELCKALPVVLFLRAQPHAGWRAACVIGLASGVGFGISEGITYSADSYNGIQTGMIYLVRFASCVALHSIWAGAVALVMNRNQDYVGGDGFDWEEAGNFILHYLLAAMVLHGLYDTLLKQDHEFWALSVAAVSFGWLAWLVRRQRMEE